MPISKRKTPAKGKRTPKTAIPERQSPPDRVNLNRAELHLAYTRRNRSCETLVKRLKALAIEFKRKIRFTYHLEEKDSYFFMVWGVGFIPAVLIHDGHGHYLRLKARYTHWGEDCRIDAAELEGRIRQAFAAIAEGGEAVQRLARKQGFRSF